MELIQYGLRSITMEIANQEKTKCGYIDTTCKKNKPMKTYDIMKYHNLPQTTDM